MFEAGRDWNLPGKSMNLPMSEIYLARCWRVWRSLKPTRQDNELTNVWNLPGQMLTSLAESETYLARCWWGWQSGNTLNLPVSDVYLSWQNADEADRVWGQPGETRRLLVSEICLGKMLTKCRWSWERRLQTLKSTWQDTEQSGSCRRPEVPCQCRDVASDAWRKRRLGHRPATPPRCCWCRNWRWTLQVTPDQGLLSVTIISV